MRLFLFKRSIIIYISILLTAIGSMSPCDPFSSVTTSAFFNPNLMKEASPFDLLYLDAQGLTQMLQQGNSYDLENILEWKGRFCDYPDTADIRYVLYQSSIDELDWMKKAIVSKGLNLGSGFSGNTFAEALYVNKCTETVDYLIFAKECEPYVLGQNDWLPYNRDTVAMQQLIKKGLKSFLKNKSNFLKLRYAYQIIRLAHYKKNYQEVIRLCDYLFPKVDKINSIVWYWIYGHQAGALRALGKNAASAQLYASVFLNCRGKRESAMRSLKITSETDWQQAIAACHSDRERTALFAMRAGSAHAKSLEDMMAIYELDPASEFLPLLLIKETARMEKVFLTQGLKASQSKSSTVQKSKSPKGQQSNSSGQYLVQLISFTGKSLQENQVTRTEVWRTCLAYLHILAGNWYDANVAIELARPYGKTNETIKEQLLVFEMALRIFGFQDVSNDMAADSIAAIRKSDLFFEYPQFTEILDEKLAFLYENAGNKGMSFLAKHSIRELAMNPDLELIDDLIAICRKEKLNQLEKTLVAKSSGETIINEILDIKATYLLGRGDIEAALATFQQIPNIAKPKEQYNPFRDRLRDCNDCNVADSILLSKQDLVQRLLDLEFQAKAALDEGAVYYYQLGLAYYNLSFFGQSHQAADFYRSGFNWTRINKGPVFPVRNSTISNRENMDVSKAMDLFEKARQMAKDPELAARAAFWGAKCELARFYLSKENLYKPGSKLIPKIPEQYRNYYGILKQRYANTDFYQLAIKECKFFEAYAR